MWATVYKARVSSCGFSDVVSQGKTIWRGQTLGRHLRARRPRPPACRASATNSPGERATALLAAGLGVTLPTTQGHAVTATRVQPPR